MMKTKGRGDLRSVDQDLEAVLRQFEHWRAGKQRGERIPKQLWQAAASLYPRYSVNKIARSLRLDGADLRNYVPLDRNNRRSKRREMPQFMSLPVAPSGGLADCRIKVTDGRRVHVSIRLKGAGVDSVVQVLRELWSGDA